MLNPIKYSFIIPVFNRPEEIFELLKSVENLDFSFDESVKDNFIDSIQQYWPDMNPDKLQPDYVGIRPKIQNPNEKMRDFSILDSKIHGVKGLINLQGIESPGVTSSLAIGRFVTKLLQK